MRAIPNQSVKYLVEEFKLAKLKGDAERMQAMFNALHWQLKRIKKINKGKTQRLSAELNKMRKLREVQIENDD